MYIYIYTCIYNSTVFIAISPAEDRPRRADLKKLQQLTETNQAHGCDKPGAWWWFSMGKSHDFPMDFPWFSRSWEDRERYSTEFFDFHGLPCVLVDVFSRAKEIHDLFLRWNNIRTDFPHGKCLRWFSQRVSFNDFPWRPECEITTGYWKLVPQLVSLSASYIGLQVGVSIKGGTPKWMVSHGKCQSKMDDLGYHYFRKPPSRLSRFFLL